MAITSNRDKAGKKKRRSLVRSACVWLASNFLRLLLRLVGLLVLPGLIPERQFDPVPKAELVVDYAEIILDNVFGCAREFAISRFLQPSATSWMMACSLGWVRWD